MTVTETHIDLTEAELMTALKDGHGQITRPVYPPPFEPDFDYGSYYREKPHEWMHPYGQPGDRLWVREDWQTLNGLFGYTTREESPVIYKVDNPSGEWPNFTVSKWFSAETMPRWAARLVLEVTSVDVVRLDDNERQWVWVVSYKRVE